MERPRKELLAGPALTFEQHGDVGGGGAMQLQRDVLQRRILADDLRRAAALRQFFFKKNIFRGKPPLNERALHHQQQVIGIDRLGEEIERAFLHRGNGILNAAERGHHDDRQLRIEVLRGAEHAESVAFGEPEVSQHHAELRGLQGGGRFGLITRFDDGVPLRLERVAQHHTQRIFVLDD
jgi:hypothetical protein